MSGSQAAVNNVYPVYLGAWTNWSLGGRITGSVLTLTHRDGSLLTAFFAIFVTFAGSRLWRIFCFILHYSLLTKDAQDGLYHQRQTTLRNAIDEKSGFLTFSRILWTWRQRAYRPYYRMLPIISFAFIMIVAFTLSGILSSRISSSMGNEVLIASPNCGIPLSESPQNVTAQEEQLVYQPWQSQRMAYFSSYAQRCYTDSENADGCTPFVKRKISSAADWNASCPFDDIRICLHQHGNIKIDTGFLNSQNDLGLNAPVKLQFNLRIITHCAPLNSRDHQNTLDYVSNKPYRQYFYGPTMTAGSGEPHTVLTNYTYAVPLQSVDELGWRRSPGPWADYAM